MFFLELKYIVSFEEIYNKDEKTYYIAYVFNKERDGDCHMSEFIKKNEKNIVKENIDGVEEVIWPFNDWYRLSRQYRIFNK